MNKDTFPIKDMWFYNPIELATHIENVMGQYLVSTSNLEGRNKEILTSFPVIRAMAAKNRQLTLVEPPHIPYLGMAIVFTCVENLIEERSEWTRRNRYRFNEAMMPYVKPEWHHTEEVFEHLRNLMIDLRTDVITYMGSDRWIMHFIRTRGFDIVIEKSIDFRVYDWTRRHEAGEF